MSAKRMNREEFFTKLAPLDQGQLRKALWTLYWRGSAAVRQRIESELDPAEQARRKQAAAEPPDPGLVLDEVREFAELARAGAYIAGDRRCLRRSGPAGGSLSGGWPVTRSWHCGPKTRARLKNRWH